MFVTVTDYHGNQIGIDPNRIIKIRQSGIADEPKKTVFRTREPHGRDRRDFPRWTPRPLGLQPRYEDVALEALIEPELLIAAGQLRKVLRDIGRQFGHRDHAVTIDIDVIT